MKTCSKCGKRIAPAFELCFDCNQDELQKIELRRYLSMTPDEREEEREAYYSNECSMCGKEGADLRKDGRYYCGQCWTVWNS